MDSNNNKNNNTIKDNINIIESNKENEEQFQSEKYKKKSECPNFLLKLYQILENDEYKDIICWGKDGTYFLVKNLHDFTENILPKYYKHNNYSSFIRQLNMYDFHKRKSNLNEHIFEHKNFIKDKKELLKLIKRKTKKDNNNFNNNYNNNNNNLNINYGNYIPYIQTKFLPSKETDIIPIIHNNNINYENNNKEKNNIYNNNNNNNNNRKSSLSIDDNLSLNNSFHSLIHYKQMPLLPMGSSSTINNNINNNIFNNNNINNYNNNEIKEDKKITKKNLQNLLAYLTQSVDQNTEMQKQLEIKIERLTKQNEEFIIQNQQMLKEIISKNDYNKKLEAVICFILEMIMSKSKMKNNPELKNLFLANEPNNQFQDKISFGKIPFITNNNNNGGILEPFQSFLTKYYEKSKNTGYLTNKENNINKQGITNYNNNIILDEDKYYYPLNNVDPNLNAKILRHNLIGDKNDDNNYQNNYQLSPFILNNKRKRSSSFNSILSNLSKESNVIYNNKKLLPEDENYKINKNKEKNEEEKIIIKNDKKNEKNEIDDKFSISRKDSISSWNDAKNVFDIDLNQDENKSYLSSWNKDLLNNSQTSYNDMYNGTSNMNKDNDILSDINN